jgi:hypothetical protein
MPRHPGATWLYDHWSDNFLPNNQWVAANSDGVVASGNSLDEVIKDVRERYNPEEITFAYITFDLCQ